MHLHVGSSFYLNPHRRYQNQRKLWGIARPQDLLGACGPSHPVQRLTLLGCPDLITGYLKDHNGQIICLLSILQSSLGTKASREKGLGFPYDLPCGLSATLCMPWYSSPSWSLKIRLEGQAAVCNRPSPSPKQRRWSKYVHRLDSRDWGI